MAADIAKTGIKTEKAISHARCVGGSSADPSKEVFSSLPAQNATAIEIELRRRIDDVAAERAARRTVAADIEITAGLRRSRVLNVVTAPRGNARRRNRAGNLAARDGGNLRIGDASNASGGKRIGSGGGQASDGVRHGVQRSARRQQGEGGVASQTHADFQEASRTRKGRRAQIKTEFDVEDAVGDRDAILLDDRSDLIAAAECIVQPELKIIRAIGREAVVVQTSLIVKGRSLGLSRANQQQGADGER